MNSFLKGALFFDGVYLATKIGHFVCAWLCKNVAVAACYCANPVVATAVGVVLLVVVGASFGHV
jgi:hypothetical protein